MRVVNGVSSWKITKGMVVTDNPVSKFSWMSTGCYEELLAHELGHGIGFGHAAARPVVMYPAISSNCGSRTTSLPLQADDLAGMSAVYPSGATLVPPGVPANLNSVTCDVRVVAVNAAGISAASNEWRSSSYLRPRRTSAAMRLRTCRKYLP